MVNFRNLTTDTLVFANLHNGQWRTISLPAGGGISTTSSALDNRGNALLLQRKLAVTGKETEVNAGGSVVQPTPVYLALDKARELFAPRLGSNAAASDASVTNANVNAAIAADPAASRTALALGSAVQGEQGISAYAVAVAGGFVGDEAAWLASLVGPQGDMGNTGGSAYDIAVTENGFIGTEVEWLASLVGEQGQQGDQGLSAFEVAQAGGWGGTEAAWLLSLRGANGADGADSTVPGPGGPTGLTGIIESPTEPTDHAQLWLDSSEVGVGPAEVASSTSTDVTLEADGVSYVVAKASALSGKLDKNGEGVNFITADASSGNAVTNGTNLRDAYAAAKLLTPNGVAKSATNRAVVRVPPGTYDLVTTPLTMDTQFVDMVGITGHPEHVLITSAVAAINSGTLVQTANDVLISGVTLESTQNSKEQDDDATDPAAYMPSTNLTLAKLRDVVVRGTNLGWSMRQAITYSGTFKDCTGGYGSFGYYGTASGTFTNCTGGNYSFGYAGVASGTFTNCTGGSYSFGSWYGTASGTFTNCTGGDYTFGYYGTASGTFTGCTGGGYSFGGGEGVGSGTFTHCTAGGSSFGGLTASGTFTNCKGGNASFGASNYGSLASGIFTNCTATGDGFGVGEASIASGIFTNCAASGGFGESLSGATCRLFFCRTAATFPARSNGAKIKQSFEGDTLVNDA